MGKTMPASRADFGLFGEARGVYLQRVGCYWQTVKKGSDRTPPLEIYAETA
jgi:hypothetical protein